MEANITTIGTILLGAFYTIGYLLNRHSSKKSALGLGASNFDENQTEFITTLSSTASQSTSLNIQLWQRVTDLEEKQDNNQQQIEMLKQSNQQKDDRIADLETQIQECLKIELK